MQIVVFANGKASFVGEHSKSDGGPAAHLLAAVSDRLAVPGSAPSASHYTFMYRYILRESCSQFDSLPLTSLTIYSGIAERARAAAEMDAPASTIAAPVRVPFIFDGAATRALERAERWVSASAAEHDNCATTFRGFGRSTIKTLRVSPDAFAQLALALTYWRLHGAAAPTYESVQVRRFHHGRTACARSSTLESRRWCEAMLAGRGAARVPSQRRECVELFRAAASAHVKTVRAAAAGHGVDRHMLGLRCVATAAERAASDFRSVFEDPAFEKSGTWVLSTSMLVSKHWASTGYAQVTPKGYGAAYCVKEDEVLLGTVARAEMQPKRFNATFVRSMLEIKALLEGVEDMTAPAARL